MGTRCARLRASRFCLASSWFSIIFWTLRVVGRLSVEDGVVGAFVWLNMVDWRRHCVGGWRRRRHGRFMD